MDASRLPIASVTWRHTESEALLRMERLEVEIIEGMSFWLNPDIHLT
jgi:hypothetical protein